jgi:cellulose synthase/poly-beta-1,6-N-acetylglucosamine synthase-like glycosyltransferase
MDVADAPMSKSLALSIVVIGRNEGSRLERCLESIREMRSPGPTELIYVDSNSCDGSPDIAAAAGARVIVLSSSHPTAAAGRNAGWRSAHAPLILFLDGDTVLNRNFVAESLNEFRDARVAVVFGNRRETNSKGSLYNRVLDLDWIPTQIGESEHCGGDALVRADVLEEVGGYDDRLIAGEEPDMCRRMRGRGYLIIHVNRPMTGHDLAIKSVKQYWRRAVRSGYAYAEIAHRYRHTSLPFWRRESRLNLFHSAFLLAVVIAGIASALVTHSSALLAFPGLIVAALAIRTAVRFQWKSDNWPTLLWYGLHSHTQHIPISIGQMQFWRDQWSGRTSALIEYKDTTLRRDDERQAAASPQLGNL